MIRDLYHKPIFFSTNFFRQKDLWAPRLVEWSSVCNCTSQLQNHHPHRALRWMYGGWVVLELTNGRTDDFFRTKFFLRIDNQISLPVVLCCQRFAHARAQLKTNRPNSLNIDLHQHCKVTCFVHFISIFIFCSYKSKIRQLLVFTCHFFFVFR